MSSPAPILLVEDSMTFREALAEELERLGHSVLKAQSAEEGLLLAAQYRPRAFVVDGHLPGMDGTSFIRRLRLEGSFPTAPCVLLTADTDLQAELRALDSGADAFVRKDDDLELILAQLSVAMRATVPQTADSDSSELLAPRRILAVDDSPTYRKVVVAALEAEGYEVVEASSGGEALELIAKHAFDCVLLDLVMPDLDGREVCRRLKSSETFRNVPVILLTAMEGRDVMLEGLAQGADDCIQKSSEVEVLKARVRAQLRRRQAENQARRSRERLIQQRMEEAEARAARELAETRARLVQALEEKNAELSAAYDDLRATQAGLLQAAKMASLGELVAGVAHEINNPLSFAFGHLRTVIECLARCEREGLVVPAPALASWDKARQRLGEMHVGLDRIRDLVVKLRTFSRIDEGERKTVSIKECVESVLSILQYRFLDGMTVNVRCQPPDEVECYPSLLNQAMLNLVANSADAIGESGTIEIETRQVGSDYVISVSDDGPGIPEGLRDRVLEPFFTTKEVGKGTGLGLPITYAIAQKHGGELILERREGGGTRALMRFPLSAGEAG